MEHDDDQSPERALVGSIAERALALGYSIGSAESLTGGKVASSLAAGQDARSWFAGGVVSYAPRVKFDLLEVEPGPVNCARCAEQMAAGALRALGCDVAVSTTGVGGPGADEGVPAGTVFIALASRSGDATVRECHFAGDPDQVILRTVIATLGLLEEHLRALRPGRCPVTG